MFTLHEGPRPRRCPCCRRKIVVYQGQLLNERTRDWESFMSRAEAREHARAGTCPFCGAKTTIVARILIQRFEPMLRVFEGAGFTS